MGREFESLQAYQAWMVGVAQLVRVPGCGPGGRGFKSLHSPQFCIRVFNAKVTPLQTLGPAMENEAPVAQLDRVADFESVGRRFESYRARQISRAKITTKCGPLAQLVEQLTLNQ